MDDRLRGGHHKGGQNGDVRRGIQKIFEGGRRRVSGCGRPKRACRQSCAVDDRLRGGRHEGGQNGDVRRGIHHFEALKISVGHQGRAPH